MMPEPRLTMYQKPTCSTCKQVMMILKDSGVEFDAIDYIIDPIGLPKLRDLVRKLGVGPRELVRTREKAWDDLGPARDHMSDEQILHVLADHPELLQRPILELGERAVLARPAERAREIFR
jgi:arsenate reductase